MAADVVNLKEISKTLTTRLLSDPTFRQEFQKDPRGCLKAAGLPEQFIPTDIDAGMIDHVLNRLDSMKDRVGQTRDSSIAVACVVV